MGAEDKGRTFWNLIDLLHEHCPCQTQPLNDRGIVNDFVANENWTAIQVKHRFHDRNGPIDTGAETPGFRENEPHQGVTIV
jgi:hypothetical protein